VIPQKGEYENFNKKSYFDVFGFSGYPADGWITLCGNAHGFSRRNPHCSLKSDGTVWAWGYNYYGQLGDGTTTQSSTPVSNPGFSGASMVAAGYSHTIALKSDGTVWAWGINNYGQLGNGTITGSIAPKPVPNFSDVKSIISNGDSVLAVKNDGSVWG
jgi:alpha-tubulin suppressor-like RCC1 family protein